MVVGVEGRVQLVLRMGAARRGQSGGQPFYLKG